VLDETPPETSAFIFRQNEKSEDRARRAIGHGESDDTGLIFAFAKPKFDFPRGRQ
jgi:hypothetical protein